jgi:hypothetical protein
MRTVLATSIFTLALAGSASAAVTVDHQKISGNTVTATWNYQDGDIATFVMIVATQDTADRFATVSILQSNVVTGNVLIAGVADLADFQLSVASDLGTAHFQAQGTFEDDSTFTFFPISIDLTWTATSGPDRQRSTFHFNEHGFVSNTVFRGTFRDASASGSIVMNSAQFVPGATTDAQLQANDFGSVTVQIGTH